MVRREVRAVLNLRLLKNISGENELELSWWSTCLDMKCGQIGNDVSTRW